jgi:hypothetical protein
VHQLSSTHDPIFSLKVPANRIIGGYTIKDGVIIPNFSNSEVKYNTSDPTQLSYKNIKPSINQEGGAEYSYNFWLNVNQNDIAESNNNQNDIILFLKGEKNLYASDKFNYNCANVDKTYNPVIITKNPLVRLSGDGKKIAVEYNNIYTADSFQQSASYKSCNEINSKNWNERNKKLFSVLFEYQL